MADLLPEADWPPELRLPPPPPPPPPAEPPPAPPAGMDDSQFLGSIMGDPAPNPRQDPAPPPLGPKKRGRPPKRKDAAGPLVAAAPKPPRKKEDDEEVVCFICFDGGNLVVCDRRGCPKVYHPACIKRDESFFNSRTKWNCGWHICSSCEKAVHYMCYTCTYSLCKVCIKQGKFFSVRGTKGFCDTCFGTILLIESKDENATKEECNRLRQSMKFGLISRLKVGHIQEKAKILQSVRVNDWFENEKERLGHLRDRASETGRRKEYPSDHLIMM
nr:unnamed protein product [Digitaria exilis]